MSNCTFCNDNACFFENHLREAQLFKGNIKIKQTTYKNKSIEIFKQKHLISYVCFPINFKMETCVLIPQEFSLVVTAAGARSSAEQVVSVWTTNRIKQGTLYYPFQGTVRIDKLDINSYIDEDDVSINAKEK